MFAAGAVEGWTVFGIAASAMSGVVFFVQGSRVPQHLPCLRILDENLIL